MSLQVWLPLTKDLRQQGLNERVVTNTGATYSSTGGNLGGCYIFDGTDDALAIGNLSTLVTNDFSFACWFYHDETWSSKSYETILGGPSGFELEGKNSSTNSPVLKAYSWGGGTITYELNKWNHLVMTRTTSETKFYLNGELKLTGSAGSIPSGDYFVGAWKTSAQQNYKGKLCDVRIYDHCLAPLEVKQISQGLVLHYTLGDKYIESTTNLITTEDCLSSTCYNGAISKYGYGTSTDMYKTVTTYDGKKGTKVYMGTNGNSCYPYVYINGMYTSNGTNAPEYKTLSFDYYTTISTSICPYKLGSGTGTASYIVSNSSGIKSGIGTNSVVIPIIPNEWNHIEVTFHGTTDADAQWGYIQNQPSHISDTSNFWFFANMQLETKDHATGYAGVGGTRTSTTIYDNSGFCNNGTISNALQITTDTIKYGHATYMSKTALITHACPVESGTNQEWTCAIWVKLDNTSQSGQSLNNFNSGNNIVHSANGVPLLYLNSGSNDYYNYGNLAVSAGIWTHVAFVFKNSNVTKLIYINGIEHTNKNGPNKTSTPHGIPATVTVGTNLAGYISDYRIYATALSADDVKSLYQNSAYIDSSGNVYGTIHEV